MRLLPGDPAVAVLGENAGPQQIAAMRERLGLNDPLWLQYLYFVGDLVRLDLGRSLANNVPIAQLFAEHLPYTLELAAGALVVGTLIGIPLGVVAAVRKGGTADHGSRVLALAGLSMPEFFLGFLLLLGFGLHLKWFPLMGAGTGAAGQLYHLVLPALTLGIIKAGFITRLTRSAMLDVLARDYVRTAEGKGLERRAVLFRHALRNALIPVVTALGVSMLATLAGTISLELVFSRPGIGRLLVGAISARDYPLIQAGLVVFSLMVVIVNLIVDLLYACIDPRIELR
jgi:peptide/nickel transport system permease protein